MAKYVTSPVVGACSMPDVDPENGSQHGPTEHLRPFERAYVSSDLRIVPCCMIGNPEIADLGDATSFIEHWQGESFLAFRQAHIEGRIPRPCQGCYEQPQVPG